MAQNAMPNVVVNGGLLLIWTPIKRFRQFARKVLAAGMAVPCFSVCDKG